MNRWFWQQLGASALLAACSGNALVPNAAGTAVSPAAVTASGRTTADFVVTVPPGSGADFVSPSTQSIVVSLAGSTLLTMNVAAGSPRCTSSTRGGRTCSQSVKVPAGSQTFDMAAYDGPKGTGNVLASGSVDANLHSGASQRVRVALTGRPATLTMTLRDEYPPAGRAERSGIALSALDADGNTILGAYARSVELVDSDRSGATKLSATSIDRSSTRIELAYDGAPLEVATITAKAAGMRAVAVPFAPAPTTLAQYRAPQLMTKNGPRPVGVSDVCLGPDGNIWATGASSGAILKIDADGKYTMYPILGTVPMGISVGADKNLWFAENQGGKIGKITTAGVVTTYAIPVPKGATSQPAWTTLGPDGRIWFVDQGINGALGFGAVSTSGKIVRYPLPARSDPVEIVAGPDKNLWITDGGLNAILVASTSGKIVATHKLPTADAAPWGIAVGPDKNLWFAEFQGNKIGRITTGGQIKEWTVPSAFAGPLNVAAGPDGNVWFTETGGGFWNFAGKVGYVTTDGSRIREFPSTPVSAHVHDLAFDAGGMLWYSEFDLAYSSLSKFAY
ncbi:MAG TPA: hypothetical protein VMF61_10305 [Candidatus Acidoferrales bacterium]|nr:hypothetical protein [Candidatus Acidoferrales bacterium]